MIPKFVFDGKTITANPVLLKEYGVDSVADLQFEIGPDFEVSIRALQPKENDILAGRELVMVETKLIYKIRYVVAVNSELTPHDRVAMASDLVNNGLAKEFSQQALNEVVLGAYPISEVKMLALCDVDNEYGQTWDRETKILKFVTIV